MIDYYVRMLSNPDSLRGSFGLYRALDTTIAQNEQRKTRRLTMPVLAIGGAASFGEHVGDAMKLVADDVQSLVIPGVGHFVAEEAPDEMLAALTAFLAPYRTEWRRQPQLYPRQLTRLNEETSCRHPTSADRGRRGTTRGRSLGAARTSWDSTPPGGWCWLDRPDHPDLLPVPGW